MESLNIRIDKWLWMVRLFKTRSMATDACNAGKIKIDGIHVKPSKIVRTDEILQIKIGQLDKKVSVLNTPKSRVGAPLVSQFYLDLTPAEEYERIKALRSRFEFRDSGEGRPTKRDRRQIEYLKSNFGEE